MKIEQPAATAQRLDGVCFEFGVASSAWLTRDRWPDMMRILRSVVLFVTPFVCNAETLKPSALVETESILIDCVHDEDRSGHHRVYQLSGSLPAAMRIFECYRYGHGEDTRGKAPKGLIGELTVKKEDSIGLDRLFEFYRLKTPGDSTTSDRIRIEYRRDGKVIGVEEFFDQSGVSTVAESFRNEGDEFLRLNSRGVDVELMKALAPLSRFNTYLWTKEATSRQGQRR